MFIYYYAKEIKIINKCNVFSCHFNQRKLYPCRAIGWGVAVPTRVGPPDVPTRVGPPARRRLHRWPDTSRHGDAPTGGLRRRPLRWPAATPHRWPTRVCTVTHPPVACGDAPTGGLRRRPHWWPAATPPPVARHESVRRRPTGGPTRVGVATSAPVARHESVRRSPPPIARYESARRRRHRWPDTSGPTRVVATTPLR